MRFTGLVCASFLGLWGLLACSKEDKAPVYVDMTYQLRCGDCQPTAADPAPHEIHALDGENDLQLSCHASEVSGKRQLTFEIQPTKIEANVGQFGLKISQARIDGKDPGSQCRVRVIEGGNVYEGACTAGEPTDTEPCQVTFKKPEGGIINGSVYCKHIPFTSNITTKRYLVAPYTEADPVEFELHNCSGI